MLMELFQRVTDFHLKDLGFRNLSYTTANTDSEYNLFYKNNEIQ